MSSTDLMLSKLRSLSRKAGDAPIEVDKASEKEAVQPPPTLSMADILERCLQPNKQKNNSPLG